MHHDNELKYNYEMATGRKWRGDPQSLQYVLAFKQEHTKATLFIGVRV